MIRAVVPALAILCAGLVLAQDDPFAFMPDGGRSTIGIVFPDAETRTWALKQDMSAEAWKESITARAPDLGEKPRDTLAAYLSVVAPYEADPASDLPPDGRDIALAQCLSCHSLFTGYLMQRRDRQGWLSTFASPFHQVIEITPEEREIFADYSAINMPMRLEDVPPELRY